jgi:hypothetical protein
VLGLTGLADRTRVSVSRRVDRTCVRGVRNLRLRIRRFTRVTKTRSANNTTFTRHAHCPVGGLVGVKFFPTATSNQGLVVVVPPITQLVANQAGYAESGISIGTHAGIVRTHATPKYTV